MKSKMFNILAILTASTFIGPGVDIVGCSLPANNPPDSIDAPGGDEPSEEPGTNPGGEQNPDDGETSGGGLSNGGIFVGH